MSSLAFGEMPCEVSTNVSFRSAERRMHFRISSMSVWYASPAITVSRRKRTGDSDDGKNARSTVWIGFRPSCFSPLGSNGATPLCPPRMCAKPLRLKRASVSSERRQFG